MSAPVVTASPSTPYKQLVQCLAENAISAMPVLDEQSRLVGIVSEADLLLKQHPSGAAVPYWEDPAHHRDLAEKAKATVAADLMTQRVHTVREDMPIARAARLMRAQSVKRLPVVDDSGALVGIVSRADLLKPFLRDDDDIRTEITETVLPHYLLIDPRDVAVTVTDGEVTMTGQVERKTEVEMITHFVTRLAGVVAVDNQLRFKFDDAHLKMRTLEVRTH